MKTPLDLTGKMFHNLTAIRKTGEKTKHGLVWEFKCACGNTVNIAGSLVKNGAIKSCGCWVKKRALDLAGKKFERLTAIRPVGSAASRSIQWECQCDCGKLHVVEARDLKSGHIKSCGCLRQELAETKGADHLRAINTTHGMSGPLKDRDLTWVSWSCMIQRTSNPNNVAWDDYGGRGIVPCEFIRISPVNLLAIIGPRPGRAYSLDRIDNNRGYQCGQCAECVAKGWSLNLRWATRPQQNRNRRDTRMITIDGVTRSETEWAELFRVSVGTIRKEYHYPLPEIRRREPGIEFTYEI